MFFFSEASLNKWIVWFCNTGRRSHSEGVVRFICTFEIRFAYRATVMYYAGSTPLRERGLEMFLIQQGKLSNKARMHGTAV
jgi:hypothetical protein